ncbi:MAG: hypothetical protein C0494_02655 [Sphingobium sp.]|nr:hypothetical protein [Sphingobium sp.]
MKHQRDERSGDVARIGQSMFRVPTCTMTSTTPAAWPARRKSDLRQGLHALAKVVTFRRIAA